MTLRTASAVAGAAMLAAFVTVSSANAFENPACIVPVKDRPSWCGGGAQQAPVSAQPVTIKVKMQRASRDVVSPVPTASNADLPRAQILPHPEGCPRTAFCGCGAAVKVFGRAVRELWLAANWLQFPRAEPAPGMVAVRPGHVFVIEQVLGDGLVLAYDANSGKGLTRLHVRSLAGYSVRDPHGLQLASLR